MRLPVPAALPGLYLCTWRYDALGFPLKLPPYKSILTFPIPIRESAASPQIIFVIVHSLSRSASRRNLALSALGSPCIVQSSCSRIHTSYPIQFVLLHIVLDSRFAELSKRMSVSSAHPTMITLEISPSPQQTWLYIKRLTSNRVPYLVQHNSARAYVP
jgi:hypothetical protein